MSRQPTSPMAEFCAGCDMSLRLLKSEYACVAASIKEGALYADIVYDIPTWHMQ